MCITRLVTHLTSSQQIKITTYYTRGNYRNYQQKPNPMTRPYQHNTRPRTSPTFNRQQHNIRGKKPVTKMVSSCDVIFMKVYIIWPRSSQKNVIYTIHKKSFFFSQLLVILDRSKTLHLSLGMQQYLTVEVRTQSQEKNDIIVI